MIRNKGITLIALIITIIVLLILAGVSIATITGENGILERAKSAKEASENATNEEASKVSQYESEIGKYITSRDGTITIDKNTLNQMIEAKVRELVNDSYSTEEQLVGTWIDGKNLYKRTFVYDTATSGNAVISVGQIENFDTAFIDESASFYINTNSVLSEGTPNIVSINTSGRNVDAATYTSYPVIRNDGTIVVHYGSTTASSKTVITVKYTKTTD